MQTVVENVIRSNGEWVPTTIDQKIATFVRGWKYDAARDAWIGDKGPEKLMSMDQITYRWSGSIDAAWHELELIGHKREGFHIILTQQHTPPGPDSFVCSAGDKNGLIVVKLAGTAPLAILKCVLALSGHEA